jgi:hypothetical protein
LPAKVSNGLVWKDLGVGRHVRSRVTATRRHADRLLLADRSLSRVSNHDGSLARVSSRDVICRVVTDIARACPSRKPVVLDIVDFMLSCRQG